MKKVFSFITLYWKKFIELFKNKRVSHQININMDLNDIQIEISKHIYNHIQIPTNISWTIFYGSIHKKAPIVVKTLPPLIKYIQYIFNKATKSYEIYDSMNYANYDTSQQYYEIRLLDIYEFLIKELQFDIFNLLNPAHKLLVSNIKNIVVNILKNSPHYTTIQQHYNDIIDRLLNSTTQCSPNHNLGTILNSHNLSSRKI